MENEKIIKKCKELTPKEIEDVNFRINMRLPRKIREEVKKRIIIEFIKKPRENYHGGWKCLNRPPERKIEFENCYDIKIKIGENSFMLRPIDGVLGCIRDDQFPEDICQEIIPLIKNDWEDIKREIISEN